MRNAPGRARVYGTLEILKHPRPATVPRTLQELLALHERLILIQALQRHYFSRTKAAESLGITRNYLWRRMKILQIDFAALPRTTPGRPRKRSA